MNTPSTKCACLLTVLVALAADAARGTVDDFTSLRARIRFSRDPGRPAPDVRRPGDEARIHADFAPGTWDPATERFRVALGPEVLLDLPPGAAFRERPAPVRVLRFRVDSGAVGRVRFSAERGILDLALRGLDLGDLLAGGPEAVDLLVAFGANERAATIDFREASPRRWAYLDPREDPPGVGEGGDGTGEPVPHRVLDAGPLSGVLEGRSLAVTDRRAWEELWGEHSPGAPTPDVDFAGETVLAVFLGQRPNTGHGVSIESVTEAGGGLRVRWVETAPGRGCVTGQQITAPFVFAVVEVPGAKASFEGEFLERDCE